MLETAWEGHPTNRYAMSNRHLHDSTRAELLSLIASWRFPATAAARLWRYVYRDGVESFEAMDELPAELRTRLRTELTPTPLDVAQETDSSDGLTRKYLLALGDGQRIETVLMRYRDRATACVSSQAGCALGCVFCATGQMGFSRNLTAGEIVAQALFVDRVLRRNSFPGSAGQSSERLRNIVLMGMGEPLLNYDAVMRALEILGDSGGPAIAAKRMTISTVGVVPGIRRLADEGRPYSLAVSLHAATQAGRAELLPAAKTWPLDELMAACRYYADKLDRKIFFEWTLIDGVNDSPEQAETLAALVHGIPAQINLIPLNPTAGYDAAPGLIDSGRCFQAILRERGIPTTIRQRRGIDIAAGCGQLAAADA